MDSSLKQLVMNYVNDNIDQFHTKRLSKIKEMKLTVLLKRKNPYLFRAKNILTAHELTEAILDAHLSSSEEELFGQFLEGLAIYISELTTGGQKSSSHGIDLDLSKDGVRYLIAIKSGPNWGNSSQKKQLRSDFQLAVRVLSQNKQIKQIQPVEGMCYGRCKVTNTGLYLRYAGKAFWQFISNDPELYLDTIEPLGYEAKRHNEGYLEEKTSAYNRFDRELLTAFCDEHGRLDWHSIVRFNSENTPFVLP